MTDWRSEVLRRLACSKFSAAEREEIARELAGYLEDYCQDACKSGLEEPAAAQAASDELDEDKDLDAHLYLARKEHPMNVNIRTRQFWLPAVTVFLAGAFVLAGFHALAVRVYRAYGAEEGAVHSYASLMHSVIWQDSAAWMFYLGWLYVLPFLGAAGAYWSRRKGAVPSVRIATGLFPVVLFTAIFLGQLGAIQNGASLPFLSMFPLPPSHLFFPFLSPAGSLFLSWILIPCAALLLGVLPCLWGTPARQDAVASMI